MNAKTTYYNGLILDLPDGTRRKLHACQHKDDMFYEIEGDLLNIYRSAHGVLDNVEILPAGTVVRVWDEEHNHPQLGIIEPA